ncbi:hypothetical protein CFC21_033168 [Triticum aestivum]|uniref:Cytochrome P450 n=2 Tax=Triticum aestivum TaxID=4565 RepID=A0A9R1F0F9_WHEAT|nr:cytochrome P450 89A2-like [Triticum aestivum]KAF7020043.1 hypothetical protein CFC21_033168 [Triticum aestivum]
MELLTLLATACCLLLAAVALRRSTRRAHARRTLHRVRDAAVAHRALNKNADAFLDRAEGFFPVVLGTGLRRAERNETIVTASHGPHWRALRCNLSADVLHPSRVASLAPLQQEAAQALVAGLFAKVQGEAASVVIRGDLNRAAFSLLARMCFGDGVDGHCVESMEREMLDLLATVGELIPVVDGSWLPQLLYRRQLTHLMGALGRQKLMYLPLIDARRRPESRVYRGGGVAYPYVDSLLDLRVPNGEGGGRRALRDDELVCLVSEFLGSGSGSTVACVEWTLAHLVDRPEVQDKLRREIDGTDGGAVTIKSLRRGMPYLNAVVLESLRMHPAAPFMMRGTHGDGAGVMGATTVPNGDGLMVQFVLGDIGRDSKVWTDPDEFRPERFLAGGEAEGVGPLPGPKEVRMLPFGIGHRHCPGTSFAMLQVKCFLAALVREFEWADDDCGSTAGGVDMTELDVFFKVMKKPLSARVMRRSSVK